MHAGDHFCPGLVALSLSLSGFRKGLLRTLDPLSLRFLVLCSSWVGSGAELVTWNPQPDLGPGPNREPVDVAGKLSSAALLAPASLAPTIYGSHVPFSWHTGHEDLMETQVG